MINFGCKASVLKFHGSKVCSPSSICKVMPSTHLYLLRTKPYFSINWMNHYNVPMTASKNLSKWTSTICEAPVVEVQSFVIWSALLTIALLLVKEVEAQAATLSQAISKTVWLIFCYLQKGYTFPQLSLSVRWQQENIYTNVKCLWNTRWDRLDEERRVT